MASSNNPRNVQEGDVLRLKSGGPLMTAEWVDERIDRPLAHCIWTDAREVVHTAFIKLVALDLVNPNDRSA